MKILDKIKKNKSFMELNNSFERESSINVATLIRSGLGEYDLNAPYQRSVVWNEDFKRSLIYSILAGITFAPVHLVKKISDEDDYWVIDGKQRLSTIISFANDEFTIELPSIKDSTKCIYLTYSQLEKNSKDSKSKMHDICKKYYKNFINYSLKTIVWKNMNMDSQLILFDNLNHSKELSIHEAKLKEFPYVKALTKSIRKLFLSKWCKNLLLLEFNEKISKTGKMIKSASFRDKDLSFILRTVEAIYGDGKNIDASLISRCCSENFLKNLHDKISEYINVHEETLGLFDDKNRLEEMFKQLGFHRFIKTFQNLESISEFLLFNNGSEKQDKSKVAKIILSLFFCSLYENDTLTNAYLLENKKKITTQVVRRYLDWVSIDPDDDNAGKDIFELKSRRINNSGSIRTHLYILGDFWRVAGLNCDKLNCQFSDAEKEIIRKKAGNKCEICGSTDNLQIDHLFAKSLYGFPTSEEKVDVGGLLCGSCNVKKSNNDYKSLNDILKYITRKFNAPESICRPRGQKLKKVDTGK